VLIDNDKIDHNYSKYLPLVKTREGDFLFVPGFIYQSLLKETDLSKIDAKKVTEQVVRFLISADLKLITAPLIREVVNVQLLKLGFEKERLRYTRIGLPFSDLQELFKAVNDDQLVYDKIIAWITSEFKAVDELIKDYT
jgi:anaerobic ribonucleoside-triphosphate reductase